jgi:GDP-mannose 6-dehydrogenase
MKVAVFGLGYVGTVTAAGLASAGHQVCGVDVDESKTSKISRGQSPVAEPGIDELIADAVRAGRLTATTDCATAIDRADISIICVGTPSTYQGGTDLSYIRRAIGDIAAALPTATPPDTGFHSLVIRSTVPPGTGDDLVAPTLAAASADTGWTVGTAMCPEFLREGTGVHDFFDPPLLVLGTADDRVEAALRALFAFLDLPLRRVEVRSAEALKYACNAFHATKVSFANEMGRLFRLLEVDARQVMRIFCEDTVLNISHRYLQPGFAFGGSCLPKDLRSMLHLARMANTDLPLLAGTLQTNEFAVRDVVDRLTAGDRRRIAILGLSFKMNTDDLRESPTVELAERLLGKGFDVRIYDPLVNPARLVGSNLQHVSQKLPHLTKLLESSAEVALSGAEVAVVASADESIRRSVVAAHPDQILDLHGSLGPDIESLTGYEGVAW